MLSNQWYKKYDEARARKGSSIDLVNDTEVLACWLFDIPTKQRDASDLVIELTTSINSCKDELQVIEDRVALNINEEVDVKGKSRFGNQSLRDAEMRRRLVGHKDYLVLKKKLVCLFEDLGKAKSQVDYWSTMFSAVKNEIFHRRTVEVLDSKKELVDRDVKKVLSEE
jgi:hypothetical protein